jgi:hypothetical protein
MTALVEQVEVIVGKELRASDYGTAFRAHARFG